MNVKTKEDEQKKALDPLREFTTYFRRGYSFWLVLILGFGNFVGIWYRLLEFDQFFVNIIDFILIAAPIVILLAALIGYVDLNYGVYGKETEILTLHNPIVSGMDVNVKANSEKLDRILEIIEGEQ